MEDYIQVLVSIDTEERAHGLQRLLLEERAAACVQVLGPISSAYWWQGQIEEAEEWLCLAKTRPAVYQRLEELVIENHPYDTPEIIAIPILTGYAGYLHWIDAETGA
jgi:periplasmic divalent cation tolerance protein